LTLDHKRNASNIILWHIKVCCATGIILEFALLNRPDWPELLKSGKRIYMGSNTAVPNALIDDLIANGKERHDIELV
jgi:hypothetical protein